MTRNAGVIMNDTGDIVINVDATMKDAGVKLNNVGEQWCMNKGMRDVVSCECMFVCMLYE